MIRFFSICFFILISKNVEQPANFCEKYIIVKQILAELIIISKYRCGIFKNIIVIDLLIVVLFIIYYYILKQTFIIKVLNRKKMFIT